MLILARNISISNTLIYTHLRKGYPCSKLSKQLPNQLTLWSIIQAISYFENSQNLSELLKHSFIAWNL